MSFFGEPVSDYRGITIDGIPAGTFIDFDVLREELLRYPRYMEYIFEDRTFDKPICRVVSGLYENRASGSPLTVLIKNDPDASYSGDALRPCTGDYGRFIKGGADYCPDGFSAESHIFSLLIAGSIARQMLAEKGIYIGMHVSSIGNVNDDVLDFSKLSFDEFSTLLKNEMPVLNSAVAGYYRKIIKDSIVLGDSLGGIVECFVTGLSAGHGDPLFSSVQSIVAGYLFALPGVTGLEFGEGFAVSKKQGRKFNDLIVCKNGEAVCETNNYGGLDGPYTNGLPLVVKAAVAPEPNIGSSQKTLSRLDLSETSYSSNKADCAPLKVAVAMQAALSVAVYELCNM